MHLFDNYVSNIFLTCECTQVKDHLFTIMNLSDQQEITKHNHQKRAFLNCVT